LSRQLDQDQEQVGGLAGAEGGREVVLDAVLFHAAEGRVGDDDVHAVRLVRSLFRGRARVLSWRMRGGHLDAVQQHVGGAEQVRELLLFDAVDAAAGWRARRPF
jgi:hypothetical protein